MCKTIREIEGNFAYRYYQKKLYRIRQEEGTIFVHGTGRRKTRLQKSFETLEAYMTKLKEYTRKVYVCGHRNSYSKT